MIFRVIVKFVEALLGVSSREERRADMYLPNFVLALGLVLCAGGTAMAIAFFFTQNTALLIFGILALVIGIVALLCWKNQSIKILSEHEFSYTTFLGNTKVYRFRDISGLPRKKWLQATLLGISILVFLIAASPGYLDLYYKEVTFQRVNGVCVLNKVYGPLHFLYLVKSFPTLLLFLIFLLLILLFFFRFQLHDFLLQALL